MIYLKYKCITIPKNFLQKLKCIMLSACSTRRETHRKGTGQFSTRKGSLQCRRLTSLVITPPTAQLPLPLRHQAHANIGVKLKSSFRQVMLTVPM